MSDDIWQRCPICYGSGEIMEQQQIRPNESSALMRPTRTCPTCSGARIISKIDGHPPQRTEGSMTVVNNLSIRGVLP